MTGAPGTRPAPPRSAALAERLRAARDERGLTVEALLAAALDALELAEARDAVSAP